MADSPLGLGADSGDFPRRLPRRSSPSRSNRRLTPGRPHKGEAITAADGFYVVGGHNPGVHGAVLTEALSSRFAVQIHVGTDYDLARSLKIEPRAVTVAATWPPARPAPRSTGHRSCAS